MERVTNTRTYWTVQGYEVRVAGIVWMQGEEDAKCADMATAYEANLTAFIPRIRTNLHAADVPFIMGQIRGKDYAFREVVRAAQHHVDALGIGAYLIETDDLTTFKELHFDTAAHLALGRRFATTMIGLQSIVEGDTNGDGAVDVGDLNAIRNDVGAWGPGDVTHDGLTTGPANRLPTVDVFPSVGRLFRTPVCLRPENGIATRLHDASRPNGDNRVTL